MAHCGRPQFFSDHQLCTLFLSQAFYQKDPSLFWFERDYSFSLFLESWDCFIAQKLFNFFGNSEWNAADRGEAARNTSRRSKRRKTCNLRRISENLDSTREIITALKMEGLLLSLCSSLIWELVKLMSSFSRQNFPWNLTARKIILFVLKFEHPVSKNTSANNAGKCAQCKEGALWPVVRFCWKVMRAKGA